jgi:hypothetical protein
MTTEGNRRRLQRAALQEHLALVEQSAVALRHSLAKCAPMELKTEYQGETSSTASFRRNLKGGHP